MIHHWLGWITKVMCILLLLKYIGRISKNSNLNNILRKIHKPIGMAVIFIAGLHSVISFIKSPQKSALNITGIVLFILILLLARTFYAKADLKGKWFQMHRHLSVVLFIFMVIHIIISFL